MIGYTTLGTNDLERAEHFYNALFETIGASQMWSHNGFIAWGRNRSDPAFCITRPFNDGEATAGNGTMIALRVESEEQVNAMHAKALELGGVDEGAPGPRGDNGFYGGYFRDLEGNKLNAYVPAKGF